MYNKLILKSTGLCDVPKVYPITIVVIEDVIHNCISIDLVPLIFEKQNVGIPTSVPEILDDMPASAERGGNDGNLTSQNIEYSDNGRSGKVGKPASYEETNRWEPSN